MCFWHNHNKCAFGKTIRNVTQVERVTGEERPGLEHKLPYCQANTFSASAGAKILSGSHKMISGMFVCCRQLSRRCRDFPVSLLRQFHTGFISNHQSGSYRFVIVFIIIALTVWSLIDHYYEHHPASFTIRMVMIFCHIYYPLFEQV